MNLMTACPRYDKCSAPICPLDPDWRVRTHLPEDRVCRWLTELAKSGGETLLRQRLARTMVDQIVQIAPLIRSLAPANVKRAIDRASKTGSRLEHHRKLACNLRCGSSGCSSGVATIPEPIPA